MLYNLLLVISVFLAHRLWSKRQTREMRSVTETRLLALHSAPNFVSHSHAVSGQRLYSIVNVPGSLSTSQGQIRLY